MAEQTLQRVEIDAGLEHVGRVAVTKKMNPTGLLDLRSVLRRHERLLDPWSAEMALSMA